MKWFIHDTYAVTIVHRVVIVFAATFLVLALLRRLLSAGIAWLGGVWWAILPINYDTFNEVHLFSLLPVLAAGIVAVRFRGTPMRAAVFGILLGAAVVQRNELVVAAAAWLAICLAYEWWSRRSSAGVLREGGFWRSPPLAYGIATLAVLLIGLLTIARATHPQSIGGWVDDAEYKQDFALCQHYAVGYQQRHHADQSIGWLDCQRFMERDFGSSTPSFLHALTSNPGAMGSHVRWNLTLFLPYAIQLALFDRTSGSAFHNPDYVSAQTGSRWALVATFVLAASVLLGLILLARKRRWWWEHWLRSRVWGWALLGSVAAMGLWVAITTHPRPAYLFPLTLSIIALIGMCAMAIVERWPSIARARAALPVIAVLLFVLVPHHYSAGYSNPVVGPGRPLAQMVSRLQPYDDSLRGSQTVLLAPISYEGCNYLTPQDPCNYTEIGLIPPRGISAERWMESHGATAVYAAQPTLKEAERLGVLERLERNGWKKVAPTDPQASGWIFLERTDAGRR